VVQNLFFACEFAVDGVHFDLDRLAAVGLDDELVGDFAIVLDVELGVVDVAGVLV